MRQGVRLAGSPCARMRPGSVRCACLLRAERPGGVGRGGSGGDRRWQSGRRDWRCRGAGWRGVGQLQGQGQMPIGCALRLLGPSVARRCVAAGSPFFKKNATDPEALGWVTNHCPFGPSCRPRSSYVCSRKAPHAARQLSLPVAHVTAAVTAAVAVAIAPEPGACMCRCESDPTPTPGPLRAHTLALIMAIVAEDRHHE